MSSTENEVSCADVLKVFADETRLAVVRQLLKGPRYVGEMNDELQIDKTLLSHHLKVLRDAGIAADRMSMRGVGESSPVASNQSAEGRALNRRVEIVLSDGMGANRPR